ncbi:MAG: aminotransferase class V-fold PLP-dependent enzyme [Hyphomicrobiaceae bacterium]
MLASQRALFDIPRDVCYLNAAAWSPLPIKEQEAARAAVGRKGQPWKLPATIITDVNERARAAAARLVNAEPGDIGLISSVAYGVATAAKNVTIPAGSRVLTIEDDHSSPVLEWVERAPRQGFSVETVKRPADGDWTAAVLAAIERRDAAPLAMISISSVHWSDGGAVDLAKVSAAAKRQGSMLLIDATHHAGIMALDVKALDPDFVIFPTYKWLLGPYGRAFIYVAKRHQDGVPLEQTSLGRRGVKAEVSPYFSDLRYLPDARRYDMGERDHFISMEMAAIGIETILEWGQPAIEARLAMLTGLIAKGLAGSGIVIPDTRVRAPHVLCIGFESGMPPGLIERLAAAQVYVAPRLGRIRISPHVYNDEEDVERFVATLKAAVAI